MPLPQGNITTTKHYKVFMDVASSVPGANGPDVKQFAHVFFFMNVAYDSAGKPIDVQTFDMEEHSKYTKAGLKAEYKSIDAENVCVSLSVPVLVVSESRVRLTNSYW